MNTKSKLAGLMCLVTAIWSGPSAAATVNMTFEGMVVDVPSSLGGVVVPGDIVRGTVSYDTTTPDSIANDYEGNYLHEPSDLLVQVEQAATGQVVLSYGFGVHNIGVWNARVDRPEPDRLSIGGYSPSGSEFGAYQLNSFEIRMDDFTKSIFDSDAIPLAVPPYEYGVPGAWTSGSGWFYFMANDPSACEPWDPTCQNPEIYFQITALNSGGVEPPPPPSPQEQIAKLSQEIFNLNLHAGISNSLDAKLDAALRALDDAQVNNDVAALGSLSALVNEIEAQRGNKLTDAQADELVSAANEIIAQLSQP